MALRVLTELCLEFLSVRGGCTGSSESTRVKLPHCWKLHVTAHLVEVITFKNSKNEFDPSNKHGHPNMWSVSLMYLLCK